MIHIKTIELNNFAGTSYRKLEFSPGVNILVGKNGSGKSTVLQGIRFGLTGRIPFNMEDLVYSLRSSKQSAGVSLEIGGDASATVSRSLTSKTKRHRLKEAGAAELAKESDVNERMEKLIGVPRWTVEALLLVDQLQLSSIVAADSSEVLKGLSRLFGLERAERAWKALGDFISQLPAVEVKSEGPILEELSAVEAQIARIEAELRSDYEDMVDLEDEDLAAAQRSADMAVVDEKRRLELVAVRQRYADNVRQLEKELAEISDEKDSLTADLQSVAKSVASLDDARLSALTWKRQISRKDEARNRLASMKTVWDAAKRDLLNCVKAEPFFQRIPSDSERKALSEKIVSLKAQLGRSGSITDDECPMCGTVVPGMADRIAAIKSELDKTIAEAEKADKVYQAHLRYEKLLTRQVECEKEEESRREAYEAFSAQLEEDKTSYGDWTEASCAAALSDYAKAALALESKRRRLAAVEANEVTGRKRLAEVELDLRQLEDRIAALSPSRGKTLEELVSTASFVSEACSEIRQTRMLIATKSADRDRLRKRLAEVVQENSEAERKIFAREGLQKVRSVLHRDVLVRDALARILRSLEDDTNDCLHALEAPFFVEYGSDMSIVAVKEDGSRHRSNLLSVGQRDLLALAFRWALASMLASDMGVLCMDEPSANLDAANRRKFFTVVLDRLCVLAAARGLQVIVASHDVPADIASGCCVHSMSE